MSYIGLKKVYKNTTSKVIQPSVSSSINVLFLADKPVALKSINVTAGALCTINSILIDGVDIGGNATNDLISIFGTAPFVEREIIVNITNGDVSEHNNIVDIVGLRKS